MRVKKLVNEEHRFSEAKHGGNTEQARDVIIGAIRQPHMRLGREPAVCPANLVQR